MTIKDLVSANENPSLLHLKIYKNGRFFAKGTTESLYNLGLYGIIGKLEIDTIVVKGGEPYRKIYAK